MSTVADKLMTDVKQLRTSIDTIELEPAAIANGAVELLNEVSASKITGEEDRYSHTDLADFEANVAGSKQAFEAVKALLAKADATLVTTIEQRFTDVEASLTPFRTTSGMASYTTLTDADKTNLSQRIDALAEPLSRVAALVLQ
jgi:iron uptake system component EfeO